MHLDYNGWVVSLRRRIRQVPWFEGQRRTDCVPRWRWEACKSLLFWIFWILEDKNMFWGTYYEPGGGGLWHGWSNLVALWKCRWFVPRNGRPLLRGQAPGVAHTATKARVRGRDLLKHWLAPTLLRPGQTWALHQLRCGCLAEFCPAWLVGSLATPFGSSCTLDMITCQCCFVMVRGRL